MFQCDTVSDMQKHRQSRANIQVPSMMATGCSSSQWLAIKPMLANITIMSLDNTTATGQQQPQHRSGRCIQSSRHPADNTTNLLKFTHIFYHDLEDVTVHLPHYYFEDDMTFHSWVLQVCYICTIMTLRIRWPLTADSITSMLHLHHHDLEDEMTPHSW